jgi:hypothetical protein
VFDGASFGSGGGQLVGGRGSLAAGCAQLRHEPAAAAGRQCPAALSSGAESAAEARATPSDRGGGAGSGAVSCSGGVLVRAAVSGSRRGQLLRCLPRRSRCGYDGVTDRCSSSSGVVFARPRRPSVAVPAFGGFVYGEGKDSAVSELKLCSLTLLEQAAREKQSSSSSFLRPSLTEVSSHGGLAGLL